MSSVSRPFPDLLKNTVFASSSSAGNLYYQCHPGWKSPTINLVPFRSAGSKQGGYVPDAGLAPETRPLISRHAHGHTQCDKGSAITGHYGWATGHTQCDMESAVTELPRELWELRRDKSSWTFFVFVFCRTSCLKQGLKYQHKEQKQRNLCVRV